MAGPASTDTFSQEAFSQGRARLFGRLLIGLFLMAMGGTFIWLMGSEGWDAVWGWGFLLLGGWFTLANLVRLVRPTRIVLDADGLNIDGAFKTKTYPWSELTGARLQEIKAGAVTNRSLKLDMAGEDGKTRTVSIDAAPYGSRVNELLARIDRRLLQARAGSDVDAALVVAKLREVESATVDLPVELVADRKASLMLTLFFAALTALFVAWSVFPDMIPLPELDPRDGRESRWVSLYRAMTSETSWGRPLLAVLASYGLLHNAVRWLRPARVYVDALGVEITRLRSRRTHRWEDIGAFEQTRRFDYGVTSDTIGFTDRSRNLPGLVKFPEEFGKEPHELIFLMDAARRSAGAGLFGAAPKAPEVATVSDAQNRPPAHSDWQPPSDGFDIRDERPPYGRYAVFALLLGLVAAGGIWLASQVVVSDVEPREPLIDIAQQDGPDPDAPPMGADEAAWVAALELDTLAGYRDYLENWPEGKFRDKAQEQIDRYDEEAWKTAQTADTIRGYEAYLEDWEDGLHADEARARIEEIKAAEDARERAAREAAEAARKAAAAEARAWNTAASVDTVQSYETYLASYGAGPNADEARARIARFQASAADEAAWQAAVAANRADSYRQYITSFPQGAHVPEAIAAIERLRPSVGRTFTDCDQCPEMKVLPSGSDVLGAQGADDSARSNEKPARPVTIGEPFAISVREVTFAQYDACVAAGGCASRPSDNGWGRGSRPVINVNFAEAQAYAQWLSNTTGKPYALPSEAQWEYAARGGAEEIWPGGSLAALCAFANGASAETSVPYANAACTDPGVGRTLPAGSLSPNGFGLRDMVGNVAEWTLDCNTLNLRDAPVDGSADARGSCGQRVVRGGSWFSGPDDLRISARSMLRRGDKNDFTGFRVVRRIEG